MKVTTPNWFDNLFSRNLSMGEENQFTSTRGLRYGPLRINKTGIFVNNGSLDSTILNSSGFHGFGLTGTEQITLDASTGVNITDGTSSVFKAEISGTNVGDVTMGAYSSGAGVFYDKSAGTFTIKGNLSAGSLSIGTSPNWFNVDSSGNMWSGHASYSSAPFRVSNGGTLVATSATISGSVTATSGAIGGWSIGSSSLYSSGVALSSSSGGAITLTNGTSAMVLESNNNPPYIAFTLSGSLKGVLLPTSAGSGGLRVLSGDMAVDNNQSFICANNGASSYGTLGVDTSNNFLLTAPSSNEFFIKSSNADTSYFHTTSSHVYINTRSNGNLYIGTGTGKMTMSSNIDMNEKNIDGCDTVWAYHFSTRSEVYEGQPFDVLSSLESIGKSKKGWNKVNHNKVHKDILLVNDKGEKGYSLDRLIEIQRIAILQLKEEVDKLKVNNN